MKPRKHWGFRIAIGSVVALSGCGFLLGLLSLWASMELGSMRDIENSILLILGSGMGGLIAYLLMSSLYRWWQKNDLETRRAIRKQELQQPHSRTQQKPNEQQRSSRIKSLRDKQS